MNKELITDKHIIIQSLQHLLIYYEGRLETLKETERDDLIAITERYIAKIRRVIIEKSQEPIIKQQTIETYK